MSLIAAEIERRNIATVCLMLLRDVAVKVRPPRALHVPFPHGYPLGAPNDIAQQTRIIRAALELLTKDAPLLVDYA